MFNFFSGVLSKFIPESIRRCTLMASVLGQLRPDLDRTNKRIIILDGLGDGGDITREQVNSLIDADADIVEYHGLSSMEYKDRAGFILRSTPKWMRYDEDRMKIDINFTLMSTRKSFW